MNKLRNIFTDFFGFFSSKRTKYQKIENEFIKPIDEDIEFNNEFSKDKLNYESMAKKTVITRVLEVETSDAIVEFPQNRTLLVEQLTDNPPAKAEVKKDLRTMEDVFNYYKPNVQMEFENPDGQTKKEILNFNEVRDFEMDGIMKNSAFLKDLANEKENYLKIEKQLRVNKVLRDAITDPNSKAALIKSLQALLKELQDAK